MVLEAQADHFENHFSSDNGPFSFGHSLQFFVGPEEEMWQFYYYEVE
jgi:hypothetical protein